MRPNRVHYPKSSLPPAEDDVIISHLILQIIPLSQPAEMASRGGMVTESNNLHRERELNQILPCWLAAHLIAPGAGLQISAASLLKTGLLPLHGSHNKQGCLSPCLSSHRLTMRSLDSLSWPCPARFIHQPLKSKTPVPRTIPLLNESTPPSYVCFSSGQKKSAQICFTQYLSTNLSRNV